MKSFKKLQLRYIVTPFVIGGLIIAIVFVSVFLAISYSMTKKSNETLQNYILDDQLYQQEQSQIVLDNNIAMFVVQQNDIIVTLKSHEYLNATKDDILRNMTVEKNKTFVIKSGRYRMDYTTFNKNEIEYTVYALYDYTTEFNTLFSLSQIIIMAYFISLSIMFACSYLMSVNAIRPIKDFYITQRQLISDASHEIKTPITVVSANLDLMSSAPNSTIASNQKWLDSSKYQIQRMSNLILQLLELSNLEESTVLHNFQKFNASDVCQGVILSFEAGCFEKNITVALDIHDGIIAKGSEIDFEKLVTILVDNAVKYTPINGHVSIIFKKEIKSSVLCVENSGKGIAADKIPFLFERFYKIDNSHAESGNSFGLGLSIAKSIATKMKGSLICESQIDEYTRFVLTLPLENDWLKKLDKQI